MLNADDFYGRDALEVAFDFSARSLAIPAVRVLGYRLENTVRSTLGVNRACCGWTRVGDFAQSPK